MKKTMIALALVVLLLPLLVFAAVDLNVTYPVFPGAPDINKDQNIASIVVWLYVLIVGIAGFAAFVMIVWGGVAWMTSTGNPTIISDAKDRIKSALLGLLLVLSSFLILSVVNPELVTLRTQNLPGVRVGEPAPYERSASWCAPPGVETKDLQAVFLCRPSGFACACDRSKNAGDDWKTIKSLASGNTVDLKGDTWDDHAESLGIHAAVDVLAFESESFQDEAICFRESVPILHDFDVQSKGGRGLTGRPTWQENIGSMEILKDNECALPGISFADRTSWERANSRIKNGVFTAPLESGEDIVYEGIIVYDRPEKEVNLGSQIAVFGDRHFPTLKDTDNCRVAENEWNDRVEYIRFVGDLDVILYEKENWAGNAVCFSGTQERGNVIGVGTLSMFNDKDNWSGKVSGIEFLPPGTCNSGLSRKTYNDIDALREAHGSQIAQSRPPKTSNSENNCPLWSESPQWREYLTSSSAPE